MAKGYEMVKSCNTDPTARRRARSAMQVLRAVLSDQRRDELPSPNRPNRSSRRVPAGRRSTNGPARSCRFGRDAGADALCGAASHAESEEAGLHGEDVRRHDGEHVVHLRLRLPRALRGLRLFILRIPGVLALVVWGIIVAVGAFWLALAAMCYQTSKLGKQMRIEMPNQANGMMYLAYFSAPLCALWACTICCLRKRIALAIGITKEAAKCIASMPIIIVFPVLQVVSTHHFCDPLVHLLLVPRFFR